MKDHSLLVERYRPTVLENFVGNETIKETMVSQSVNEEVVFSKLIDRRIR